MTGQVCEPPLTGTQLVGCHVAARTCAGVAPTTQDAPHVELVEWAWSPWSTPALGIELCGDRWRHATGFTQFQDPRQQLLVVAQLLKPYPAYTTVSLYRNNVGTTRYQGFELSVRQRLARGLLYSIAYTRSKLLDDASSVFDASIVTGPIANPAIADTYDRGLERDYSTGDIPHVLVSSLVWDLPMGAGRAHPLQGVMGAILNDWSVTSLITLQSGVPVAVTQTTNFNSFAGFGLQRPNQVADPTLPANQRTPSQWFNTAAFAIAPVFTLGSASRNPIRGPSYRNVDFALIRRVPIHAGASLEIRAEIFNLLNTPNLGAPNAVAGAANFGTITSALDPRVGQFAVKLLF